MRCGVALMLVVGKFTVPVQHRNEPVRELVGSSPRQRCFSPAQAVRYAISRELGRLVFGSGNPGLVVLLHPVPKLRRGPKLLEAFRDTCVCSDWTSDAVAADKITPPWLVWEWLLVELFVRADERLTAKSNIPGIQKIQRALRGQRPIGASAYLKTPGTFGFTGVFRRLALKLGILTEDGRLDDGGYELVDAWAKDQRLECGRHWGSVGRERSGQGLGVGCRVAKLQLSGGLFERVLASKSPVSGGARIRPPLKRRRRFGDPMPFLQTFHDNFGRPCRSVHSVIRQSSDIFRAQPGLLFCRSPC